jgi:hypothetical protein
MGNKISNSKKQDITFNAPKYENIDNDELIKMYNIIYYNNTNFVFIKKNSEVFDYNSFRKDIYIIFCHDIKTDIVNIYNYCKKLSIKYNVNVIIPEYDGFSINQNNPSLYGCLKSIENAYEYLILNNVKENNIFYEGHLFGSNLLIDILFRNKKYKNPIMMISYEPNINQFEEKLNLVKIPIKIVIHQNKYNESILQDNISIIKIYYNENNENILKNIPYRAYTDLILNL